MIPISCLIVISIFASAFHDRYLITTLPAVSILAAIGLQSIESRQLRRASVVLLIVMSIVNVVGQYQSLTKRDWRTATNLVLENSKPGDAILFYGWMAKYPFEYYYRRSKGTGESGIDLKCVWPTPFLQPSEIENVAAHNSLVTDYRDPDPAWFELLSKNNDRLWVVLAMDNIEGMNLHSEPIISQIETYFARSDVYTLDRITIIRYDKSRSARLFD
jgi:hypothetical protein